MFPDVFFRFTKVYSFSSGRCSRLTQKRNSGSITDNLSRHGGALEARAENVPLEPDPGNTGGGNGGKKLRV